MKLGDSLNSIKQIKEVDLSHSKKEKYVLLIYFKRFKRSVPISVKNRFVIKMDYFGSEERVR